MLAGVGQANLKTAEKKSRRLMRSHTFDKVRIAQGVVNHVNSLHPFVTIGMEGDCRYVPLAHLHQKLAKDYPLHGFVNAVEHS